MATPSSGVIKFTDIENEFGQATNRSIGSYVSDAWDYGDYEAPLDRGPEGGTSTPTVKSNVKFSDFYNRELNVVADFYSGSAENRQDAHTRYNATSDVVGPAGSAYGNGSQSPPSNGGGKRVIISINKSIGSEKTDDSGAGDAGEQKVALKTGDGWTSGTELFIHVGNNGRIAGAGGDAGSGAGRADGTAGKNATSGLGIQWEGTVVTAINNGKITTGYPGGGGGGGSWAEREERWRGPRKSIAGSGGGGGAGLPAGNGGTGGASGTAATLEERGLGGASTSNTSEGYGVHGGAGGDGAEASHSAGNGGGGWTSGNTENTDNKSGGAAGQGLGAAIRKTSGSISWTFGTGHVTNNVVGEGKDGSGESPTGVA